MTGETSLTVVGNLVADPELRFTQSSTAVCNFRVASTARHFDKQRQEWVDSAPLFLSCTVWREAAEHAAGTLTKGTRVIVTGTLRSRQYETTEGEKRTVMEVEVEEVGPSLRFASATVQRRQASPVAAVPASA
jgi:single-strand DNA-binding protein